MNFIGTLKDLDYVLKKSDIVVLSIALNKQTHNLIGKRELKLKKPYAILVNVARAALTGEDVLYEHPQYNPAFRAGVDAWQVEPFCSDTFKMGHPFCELPNLSGLPLNLAMVSDVIKKAFIEISRFAGQCLANSIDDVEIIDEGRRCIHEM